LLEKRINIYSRVEKNKQINIKIHNLKNITMEQVNEQLPKTNNKRIVIGLVLITLAGLLFADNFNILPWNWEQYVFNWQMILIVIGLISLAKNESRTTGIILIAIGGFFLAARFLEFPFGVRHLFWPTILAAIGVLILVHRKGHHNHHTFSGSSIENSDDYIDDVAIFGGSEQKVKSRNFKGGRLTNIFGGSSFDMLDAQLAPGRNIFDVFCVFGGSKFIIPADWKVRVEVTAIFGGFADKRKSISTSETSFDRELVIKGLVLFGGGEIKNL
jgi:predicted membrane protein